MQPSPSDQMMQYILAKWISKPIYVATALGIADHLADGRDEHALRFEQRVVGRGKLLAEPSRRRSEQVEIDVGQPGDPQCLHQQAEDLDVQLRQPPDRSQERGVVREVHWPPPIGVGQVEAGRVRDRAMEERIVDGVIC